MCQKVAHTILFYVYHDHTFVNCKILAKIHLTKTMCIVCQYYTLTHIIIIISLIVASPLIIIHFLSLEGADLLKEGCAGQTTSHRLCGASH